MAGKIALARSFPMGWKLQIQGMEIIFAATSFQSLLNIRSHSWKT
jgi:hypothetical protein